MSMCTIYEGFPILNGSKVKDENGTEYTHISGNQKEGTVTVKCADGSFRTTSAPTFFCTFKWEDD